jgi:hypothetical protein
MEEEEHWAAAEFALVELGDKRRKKRLIQLAEQRAGMPNGSIPNSCGGRAATKAAYRLLDNEAVGAEEILAGHYASSIERAQAEEIVLAVQDTTELNYSQHPSTKGLGYLSALSQQGMYVHSTLLITPERVPLGLIDQYVWMRAEEDFRVDKEQHKSLPITDKESWKWLVSLEATQRAKRQLPHTQVINVGDAEADVFDVLLKAQQWQVEVIIRAAQNRVVAGPAHYLWRLLEQQPLAGTLTVQVPRQKGKAARQAEVEVRFTQLTLPPPTKRQKEGLESVQLWAVLAQEPHPPAGEAAVEWLLLTTLCVTSFREAQTVLHYYSCRWGVETYHKVLKSGCRVEERQFTDADNLLRYLALDAVVAWRVLYLTMLSRALPNLPCTVFFAEEEWQALACFIRKAKQAPTSVPSLQQATRWVAQLGGFLGRKSDGHPGPMSIWRGLQRLTDITATWLLFHDS